MVILFLSILLIVGCSCVIFSSNPIYSLLFLVSVFSLSVVLFLYLGVEFLALLMLIIYVGAISILFLFVVMMLNIRVVEMYSMTYQYLPMGLVVGFLLLCEMFIFILLGDSNFYLVNIENNYINWSNFVYLSTNMELIAIVLFNYYWVCLMIVGLILFMAMLGAMVIAWENQKKIENQMEIFNKNLIIWKS